jgi:alkylation response protein AidB-like acyl-CoA dehydrogenase
MLNPDAPLVAISKHPDVKRMLLWMKSHLEGQRMLIYYLYYQMDLKKIAETEDKVNEAQALLEILTPIAKAGCRQGC